MNEGGKKTTNNIIDLNDARRNRGLPPLLKVAVANEAPLPPDPIEHLLNGDFVAAREQIERGAQGHENSLFNYYFGLWHDYKRFQEMDIELPSIERANPHVKLFLQSVPGSLEFFNQIFAIMRESGYTTEDRVRIEAYFGRISAAEKAQNPSWYDPVFNERMGNMRLALQNIFPTQP